MHKISIYWILMHVVFIEILLFSVCWYDYTL